MKKNINSTNKRKAGQMSFLFLALTILHYLSGLVGLLSSIIMAISHDNETKILAAIVAVLCTIVFAAIHPDNKYKKLETGWRILDKKLNRYP